jgi:hypothetical protein
MHIVTNIQDNTSAALWARPEIKADQNLIVFDGAYFVLDEAGISATNRLVAVAMPDMRCRMLSARRSPANPKRERTKIECSEL